MKREKICGIYCIENLINGKKYIGQSKDIFTRWNSHFKEVRAGSKTKIHNALRKYEKQNFNFYILELCDYNIINEREIFWIKNLNTLANGYNLTSGGEGIKNKKFTTLEKEKSRQMSIGKNKPVLQISKDGEIIKEWFSCKEIGKKTEYLSTNIHDCLKLKDGYRLAYGFIWIYKADYNSETDLNIYINDNHLHLSEKIYQIDNNGSVIKIWDNINAVIGENSEFKLTSIYSACNVNSKDKKTMYGFVWVYDKNYKSDYDYSKEFIKKRTNKPIKQMTLAGDIIQIFESISVASETLKISKTSISECLRGIRNTTCGYVFKYN